MVKNPPTKAADMGLVPDQEDPTCQAAEQLNHVPQVPSLRSRALEPHYRAHPLQALKPDCPRARAPQ